MGIEVMVVDESGAPLAWMVDSANVLHRVLPAHEDATFRHCNCVDWYGDTLFNHYQIPEVLRELRRLASMDRTTEELNVLHQLDSLAQQALAEPHLYLKFVGD